MLGWPSAYLKIRRPCIPIGDSLWQMVLYVRYAGAENKQNDMMREGGRNILFILQYGLCSFYFEKDIDKLTLYFVFMAESHTTYSSIHVWFKPFKAWEVSTL